MFVKFVLGSLLLRSVVALQVVATRPVRRQGRRLTVQMPSLFVTSAHEPKSGASALCKELSSCVARCLGKPESYVLVSFKKVDAMTFGGSDDPAACLYLSSLGAINPENNKRASAEFATILETELGVTKDRYYCNFYDSPRPNMGYNGGTF